MALAANNPTLSGIAYEKYTGWRKTTVSISQELTKYNYADNSHEKKLHREL